MERLIESMKHLDFEWPTCPEAGTGKPGFERYENCPLGWTVGHGQADRGDRTAPGVCVKSPQACTHREGCGQAATMPRPLRSEPYYFELRQHNGVRTRHWFSLQH
jgi:hypothetical protein